MNVEQLFDEVLALSEEDRYWLAEAVINSLEPKERRGLHMMWQRVIESRSAEVREGRVQPVPWTEVKRQAREKLDG